MKKTISGILGVALALAGVQSAQAQTWVTAINEAITTGVAGGTNTNLSALGGNGAGVFVAGNLEGTNRKILKFDTTISSVSVVATDAQLVAAIAAVNGAAADPAATAVRFQGLGFNSNGKIIAYLDGSAMAAALLAIEPNPPYTINVLSAAVGSQTTAPVEGGNGFTMRGNIAYMLVDGGFSAAEDALISVDTSTIVNTGAAPVTTVIGEAAILAASGDTAANNLLNDLKFLNNNQAVAINSGAGTSNDNLVLLNVTSGTASLYVNATDIEADTSASDVGYSSIGIDQTGKIYLANVFGATNVAPDDGVIFLTGVTPPNATATFDSEAKIVSDLGGTDAFLGADGLFFEAASNRMYAVSDGTGNSGLVYYRTGPQAGVKDWSLYKD